VDDKAFNDWWQLMSFPREWEGAARAAFRYALNYERNKNNTSFSKIEEHPLMHDLKCPAFGMSKKACTCHLSKIN